MKRSEELKERMAILTNDSLHKIVYEDFYNYEPDAVEAAKAELVKREDNNESYDAIGDLDEKDDFEEYNENNAIEIEIDPEVIKENMTGLTEDELRELIYIRSRDYQKSAVDAAKEELYRRNVDILEATDSVFFTFKELITKASFDGVINAILERYPDGYENVSSYKAVLSRLVQTEPSDGINVAISIEVNEIDNERVRVFGIDTICNEKFGVEFFAWSDWLAFHIPKEILIEFGMDKLIAYCLLTMTSNGFSEDEIKQRYNELENGVAKVNEGVEEQKELAEMPVQNATLDNMIVHKIDIKNNILRKREMPQVRPWVRMWARSIDGAIWGILLYFVWFYISPKTYNLVNSYHRYIDVFLFFWIFAEALLLSTWGTTPGKWILKVYVREDSGEKLTFKRALYRSVLVWLCGEGCGILYLGVLTGIASYFRLTNKGVAIWDEKGSFKIAYSKIGFCRAVLAAAIVILPLMISCFILYKK